MMHITKLCSINIYSTVTAGLWRNCLQNYIDILWTRCHRQTSLVITFTLGFLFEIAMPNYFVWHRTHFLWSVCPCSLQYVQELFKSSSQGIFSFNSDIDETGYDLWWSQSYHFVDKGCNPIYFPLTSTVFTSE